MKTHIELKVNGVKYQLEIPPNRTLLDIIRDDLGLNGTKRGCEEGECGACTVHLDGRAVNACLILGVDANGREVTTIEGIAKDGILHPLQVAFVEEGAIQCGYCTPGMVMQALDLLVRIPSPTTREIRENMVGNLCRCTGYEKIVQAIAKTANRLQTERLQLIKEAMSRRTAASAGKRRKAAG